ncbi:POT family proton-dependent oligopeptide transporter [Lachnospiraceae bacterium PF1-21]|uniref:Peptide MFS transporter n=1 Tax=Ohessyouella blattaphilus TaxID=2949333 RepID=A0ABT1ELJ2_9FIRM|nr:peptide MFS transporter [Ohessyouella blattaphilus]MCP1111573.1 peptide MFS transporter [Ohessyouella blattaphilus]MCR8564967.1 peptide MFS transporter [Ohessyouella blattaphilus]MDL2249963.1 peptide MFS transporter [Lachnospiraceae bacterium OttesenSCG-928-J05]
METVAKKRKPFGFYVCSLGFTFERCAFYTVKYMLAIWIAVTVGKGGLGYDDIKATSMSAMFVAMTYITPIVGGWLADYFISPRLSVFIGMLLMGAGYLCTWQAKSLGMVWAMIILVAVGTGLFKGNLSGVNGLQFSDENELNEAFSIQYSFVNIGSFIGTTFLVLLIPTIGYNNVFLICAILMFIDAAWFFIGARSLGELGKKPFKIDQRQFKDNSEKEKAKNQPLTSTDKKRVVAIILVTLFSVVFWCVWYLAYYPAYFYFGWGDGADFLNRANWMIGSFHVPTSYFDSMNALTCIVLGPILGRLWTKLAARPKGDMSMFKKTALGIMLVGVSYIVMVIAAGIAGTGQTSLIWIALVSLLMSVGEMIFSPLGNSFISKLAPSKLMGLLLGLWPIAVFFSQMLYPKIYALLKTDVPAKFMKGYGILGVIVIGLGLVLFFGSKTLDKLEQGE